MHLLSSDLSTSIPKVKFPLAERNPRHAYAAIDDELMLDGCPEAGLELVSYRAAGIRYTGMPVIDTSNDDLVA